MGRVQLLSSRIQNHALPHGQGKMWLEKARIFVGEFHMNNLKEGHLYELQSESLTHNLYKVSYNYEIDNE